MAHEHVYMLHKRDRRPPCWPSLVEVQQPIRKVEKYTGVSQAGAQKVPLVHCVVDSGVFSCVLASCDLSHALQPEVTMTAGACARPSLSAIAVVSMHRLSAVSAILVRKTTTLNFSAQFLSRDHERPRLLFARKLLSL